MKNFRSRFLFRIFVILALSCFGLAKADYWSATGNMPYALGQHNATLLDNGKVLVVTGAYNSTLALLYSPTTGIWSVTGQLPFTLDKARTTLLPNGKVLIMGGSTAFPSRSFRTALYDPNTGIWTDNLGNDTYRYLNSATVLPNGKVLIAGGTFKSITYDFVSKLTQLYDPNTGIFTRTADLPVASSLHTATLLLNGKVLVAGGGGESIKNIAAFLYDPVTGTWATTGNMPEDRVFHTATLLPNGKVLVAGGRSSTNLYLASATLYDPLTGTWTATGKMPEVRLAHTATLLPNGKVLVAGGAGGTGGGVLASAALYDPATGTWAATSSMTFARDDHTSTLLPNGKVLTAGGSDDQNKAIASAELYNPDTGTANDPDFIVTALTLSPAAPAINTAFTAKVTIKNNGKSTGDGGKLLVWTNQAAKPLCGASAEQALAIGSLASGASTTLTITGLQVSKAGSKTFRVFADGNCDTSESTETNNQRTLRYRVHSALPDFVVNSILLSPLSPKANSTFTASVTVANQGTKAGDAGYLDVWADQANAQACGAQGDAWVGIGTLNPGTSKTVKLRLVAGTPGIKTLRTLVNSWCESAEANDQNNQLSQSYTAH